MGMTDEDIRNAVRDALVHHLESAPNEHYLEPRPNPDTYTPMSDEEIRIRHPGYERHPSGWLEEKGWEEREAVNYAEHLQLAQFALDHRIQQPNTSQSWTTCVGAKHDIADAIGNVGIKTGFVPDNETYIVEIKQLDEACTPFYKRMFWTRKNCSNMYWEVSRNMCHRVESRNLGEGHFKITITET